MRNILIIIQIIVSFLLIAAILLQPKGEGFSQTIGGASEFYKTRRGMEKILFSATIFLIIVFLILSILGFILR